MTSRVVIDGNSLAIEDVAAVASAAATVRVSDSARERGRVTRRIVESLIERRAVAYGVTTGFGKLSEIAIPPERLAELQVNLVRSHAAGVGQALPEREVRAMMLLR